MKAIILLSVVALLAGCTHGAGANASEQAQTQAARDEADLAQVLRGRVAGPPQDCVNEPDLGGNTSYGRGVIVFGDPTGEVIYVNRPPAGCPELGSGRALMTRTTKAQLCRGDIVTVFDPVTRMEFGGCSLGAFTPYRKTQ